MADESTSSRGHHPRRNAIKGDELSGADRALARKFGYKPVFKREFGYLSSFSFAVSISGLFSTVVVTFNYPLAAGGSASVVWCWFISGAGCMCIALSVAEVRLRKILSPLDAKYANEHEETDAIVVSPSRLSPPTQPAAAYTTPSPA